AHASRLRRLRPRRRTQRAPPASAQQIQAAAGGDSVQPCAEGGSALESRQSLPRSGKRLLESIFRVDGGSQDSVAMRLQLPMVGTDQLLKGHVVSRAGTTE